MLSIVSITKFSNMCMVCHCIISMDRAHITDYTVDQSLLGPKCGISSLEENGLGMPNQSLFPWRAPPPQEKFSKTSTMK